MPIYLKGNKLYQQPINKTIIPNHIISNVSNRISGKNASTDRLVYSSQNPYGGVDDAGTWVRNPNCWINGVTNISCFSPAQLSGSNWYQRAGTLITKKHVIFAKHYYPSLLPNGGTPIIFVDANNNAIKRNIIQYSLGTNDIAIGLLDNEVSSNIKVAKVLPPNYKDYIQVSSINGSELFGLLAVALDQEEKALIKSTTTIDDPAYNTFINFDNMSGPNGNINPYPEWTETIVSGDSGNPIFYIIDNELVIVTTWFSPTAGFFFPFSYNEMNSIIESLSPSQGYSLTPIDLQAVYDKYYSRSFKVLRIL